MSASTATHPHEPWIRGDQTYGSIGDAINAFPLRRGFGWPWLAAFGMALSLMMLGLMSVAWLLFRGVGVWGINIPVGWGFAIINFVWWIGIGHAGTLISAILLLVRQKWRTSINRFAEAMTLFALANAGMYPLLHLGRIWKFYYLLPYPNVMDVWPQWRSPLIFDVFAITTYTLVSFLFWYVGLLPDMATLRDSSPRKWVRLTAGVVSMGWRGSARHWQRYQMLYLLLAGLATPLVVSVHTIVSFDFSVGIVPGWHSTIFPPYFVAGAIYSGFAMVLCLLIPLRALLKLGDFITPRHFDLMGKVMLTSGLVVAYGYVMETFTAWYSGEIYERFMVINRAVGAYAPSFWALMLTNVVAGQLLWFRAVRRRAWILFLVAMTVNVGMWLERYVIVIISLHRDFLPSSWGMFTATFWDWTLYIGTIGLFLVLLLLFIRMLPSISISEVRELWHGMEEHGQTSRAADQSDAGDARPADTSGAVSKFPRTKAAPEAPVLYGIIPIDALYGVMAEFASVEGLLKAARQVRDAGYRTIDAFTPFPIQDLPDAMGWRRTRMPLIVLTGAIIGGCTGYFLQWYSAVIDYPLNIGGRPLHSWPSFIPLTFELSVLGGAVFGVVGLIVLNRLPQPYHPSANAPGFDRATRDRFFLVVESRDDTFDRVRCRELLETLDPVRVSEVAK